MNERGDIELIDGERYALNTNKGVREIELHILRNGKLVGEFNGGQIVDLGVGARNILCKWEDIGNISGVWNYLCKSITKLQLRNGGWYGHNGESWVKLSGLLRENLFPSRLQQGVTIHRGKRG